MSRTCQEHKLRAHFSLPEVSFEEVFLEVVSFEDGVSVFVASFLLSEDGADVDPFPLGEPELLALLA